MMITAIKPVYRSQNKQYDIEVLQDASPLAAHHGYLVFDDVSRTLQAVLAGRLISSWKQAKRQAVIAWLTNHS